MNRDGSQNNHKSVPSLLKGRDTSCFNLRTVPIITVSGAHSGVGKTKVAEILLRALKGWSALKVTVTHREDKCPARKNCHTCDELKDDFLIISDKKIIEMKGKDTARFKEAGAQKVLWLKSKPQTLGEGLKEAIPLFKKTKGLIMESNSALKHLKPDLALFIKNKNSILKPSAREIINKIDLVVTL
ncbi:MAG TPA: hypothetical protein DCL49_09070 [Candidatus Omnitrophica bacterium]|nr:hypothetical protein [Candidatus Omnitrophota bacterium]HBU08779.1 hypothetical protein [Candidatus Omnitrophota bacterium]